MAGSEADFKEAAAAVEEDSVVVKIEDSGAVVVASVAAVIVASANKTAMPLLTPQQDRDLTIGLGVLVIVIVNVNDPSVLAVVGITRALAPAHLMIDLVDPRHDTTETGERALTSNPSVTDANTAITTAREMTTAGNVGTKVATKTRGRFVGTKSPLIETTPCCLGGYVLSSRFSQLLFRLVILLPPFCHQG